MNNSKTAMIDMKPKDTIKLSNVEMVKSEEFADEKPLPEDGLYRYFYHLENNMAIKNDVQLILFRVKMLIDLIGKTKNLAIEFCITFKVVQKERLYVKN